MDCKRLKVGGVASFLCGNMEGRRPKARSGGYFRVNASRFFVVQSTLFGQKKDQERSEVLNKREPAP